MFTLSLAQTFILSMIDDNMNKKNLTFKHHRWIDDSCSSGPTLENCSNSIWDYRLVKEWKCKVYPLTKNNASHSITNQREFLPWGHTNIIFFTRMVEFSKTPVNQPELSQLMVNHNVVRLDISVHYALWMTEIQSLLFQQKKKQSKIPLSSKCINDCANRWTLSNSVWLQLAKFIASNHIRYILGISF